MLSLADLEKAGFVKVGFWALEGQIIKLNNLCADFPKEPGVYLFVTTEIVRYVGKTERSLHKRLHAYEKALKKPLRRRPVHSALVEETKANNKVFVYTLSITPEHQFFNRNGLPVDYLTGLEAGLIENLNEGQWNHFGAAVRAKRRKLRGDS